MFVDDLTMNEARDEELRLVDALDGGERLTSADREQMTWDLEDVREHIATLIRQG